MWAKKIDEVTTQKQDEIIQLLESLVNIPSVTGNEGSIQKEVARILRGCSLEVDLWEPDDVELAKHPAYVQTGESFRGRPCVVGIWRGAGGGKSLIINGHVDVVNEEPVERWNTAPFQAVVQDGKLYGRGSADMKGGIAAGIAAIKVLQAAGFTPRGDVLIESVPAEENGGNGTVAAIVRGYRADAAIIPEPTGCRLQPAHRGAAFWKIHIKGIASHGGTKYKGVSAVEKGILIANALAALEKERNENICSKHPLYREYPVSAPVTLGIFKGGQFTSAVPEECVLEGCIEFVPGETSGGVVKQFEAAVRKSAESDHFLQQHPPRVEWFGLLYDPSETPCDHPFVKTMEYCYQDIAGTLPQINGFEAGTDMRTLCNFLDIPGLMFGPGELAMAHAPNEYVEIRQLLLAVKVIARTIVEWCGGNDSD